MKNLIIILAIFGLTAFSAFAQNGKIAGKLTYPSDGIPLSLVLCVKTAGADGGQIFCSNNRAKFLRESNIAFKVKPRTASYEVNLPAGNYYLYATVPEIGNKKAFYNEFVKCGMNIECKSKKAIIVKVKAGQTTRGIIVGDWYD